MDHQLLKFFREIGPIIEQYEAVLEEERELQRIVAKKKQLENQLMGFKSAIINLAHQFQQQQQNPNNWPICPETGQPYDPNTKEKKNGKQ